MNSLKKIESIGDPKQRAIAINYLLEYYCTRRPDRNRWPRWLVELADYENAKRHPGSHHKHQQAFENEMEDLAVVDKPYLMNDLTKQQLKQQHTERVAANVQPAIRIDPKTGERTVLAVGPDGGLV